MLLLMLHRSWPLAGDSKTEYYLYWYICSWMFSCFFFLPFGLGRRGVWMIKFWWLSETTIWSKVVYFVDFQHMFRWLQIRTTPWVWLWAQFLILLILFLSHLSYKMPFHLVNRGKWHSLFHRAAMRIKQNRVSVGPPEATNPYSLLLLCQEY